jgi:hypothetical protein
MDTSHIYIKSSAEVCLDKGYSYEKCVGPSSRRSASNESAPLSSPKETWTEWAWTEWAKSFFTSSDSQSDVAQATKPTSENRTPTSAIASNLSEVLTDKPEA